MADTLKVALIQNTLDAGLAWNPQAPHFPFMNETEAERIWMETCNALRALYVQPDSSKPHIVVLPEFGVAHKHENELKKFSDMLGSIIISGLDFSVDGTSVHNEAMVYIPYNWPHNSGNCQAIQFRFGKRHPARKEQELIEKTGKYTFGNADKFYILDLGEYGKVGLVICANFYDLERYVVYQGRIQHLFLIAYNQDTESFHHLTESYARLVYCNVLICNTGFHGGSTVFCPRKESYRRIVYSHYGEKLSTVQTVELPVQSLVDAQTSYDGKNFKSPPPGYDNRFGKLSKDINSIGIPLLSR